jgi:hypothetical protein
MKNNVIRIFCYGAFITAIICISGCAENIRRGSADMIATRVTHVAAPDKLGLSWFAPTLHLSRYRTLFYGYDTVDYYLAAPQNHNKGADKRFFLLIDARYGGNVRQYGAAELSKNSALPLRHLQHETERCQFFNSLIYSCLYRDRFILDLSRSDLERVRGGGLQLLSASGGRKYERIDLPADYVNGFLKAIALAD